MKGTRKIQMAAYVAVLAVLTFNAATTYRDFRTTAASWVSVTETHEVLGQLTSLLSAIKDAETGQRGFLLTGRDEYLEPYTQGLEEGSRSLQQLRQDRGRGRPFDEGMAALEPEVQDKLTELGETIRLKRAGRSEEALAIVRTGHGKEVMDRIRQTVARLVDDENRLRRRRTTEAKEAAHRALLTFGTTSTLALALLGIVYAVTYRASERLRQSEQWLQTTLESIGDAVIATDPEGRVKFVNSMASTFTGWALHEAAGQELDHVFCTVNEFTRTPAESPVAQVLRDGLVVGLANHTVLISRDGTERPIRNSGAPICDSAGRILGVVLVFTDESERRAAEWALRASEAEYRAVFEADAVGHAEVEVGSYRFVRVNQKYCELTGYSEGDFLAGVT